jgi:glycosyltransferase involved in cell wall biosynthesis
VIHPPVDTDFFQPTNHPKRDFFLTVSALVPYKEIDRLVETFNQVGDTLIVVGKGPEEKKLKKMARENIIFKKNLSAEELRGLYQHAAAFIFAGIEDFGISFVEAQACGTPVLAYKKGGVLDIVSEDTGFLFEQQTMEHITAAVNKIKKMDIKPSIIRENSIKFSRESFKKNFEDYMKDRR